MKFVLALATCNVKTISGLGFYYLRVSEGVTWLELFVPWFSS